MATGTGRARRVSDKYLDLVRKFPLRPIRTEAENDEAIAIIEGLHDRPHRDPAEEDYLDVLVSLVERFEEEHYPLPPISGASMVRFLMDQHGLTQGETAKGAGIAESTFSELLAGKRKMSTKHVRGLAKLFGVSADLIIGDRE